MSTQKLLASPASIIVEYIVEKLKKMTKPSDGDDWPLYVSHLPDGLDVETNCGAVYGTSGVNEPRSMTGEVLTHFGIQLRIRSRNHEVGYVKIEDIVAALDGVVHDTIVIDSLNYEIQNVSRASPIVFLGSEPGTKRRFSFTVNYLLTIRELTN